MNRRDVLTVEDKRKFPDNIIATSLVSRYCERKKISPSSLSRNFVLNNILYPLSEINQDGERVIILNTKETEILRKFDELK